MLTRTYVNLRYWFYAIGNTPAVDLLCDLSLSKGDHVNILSLGCGDVRNILFTLWSQGPLPVDTSINVTACDTDSAILARNVFLLSFIIKHEARLGTAGTSNDKLLDTMLSIYYHFFLTRNALDILQNTRSSLQKH